MRRIPVSLSLCALLLALPEVARAQTELPPPAPSLATPQSLKDCEANNPGTSIPGCTAIIDGGQEMGAYIFEAYANRAVAEATRGQLDPAIADASQAIALNPENATILITRAKAYGAEHQLDPAIADLNAAMALNPSDPSAFNLRGVARLEQGRPDLDVADQTTALTLDPQDSAALLQRAIAETALGETDPVIADTTQALALAATPSTANPHLYILRGAAYGQEKLGGGHRRPDHGPLPRSASGGQLHRTRLCRAAGGRYRPGDPGHDAGHRA